MIVMIDGELDMVPAYENSAAMMQAYFCGELRIGDRFVMLDRDGVYEVLCEHDNSVTIMMVD